MSVENPLPACGLHMGGSVILGLNLLDHETIINLMGGKTDSPGWGLGPPRAPRRWCLFYGGMSRWTWLPMLSWSWFMGLLYLNRPSWLPVTFSLT